MDVQYEERFQDNSATRRNYPIDLQGLGLGG